MRMLVFAATACIAHAAAADTADDIFEQSGVKGGLVVHLGHGTGDLTAALHKGDAFLVHGLDRDPANVTTARKLIVERGLHGKVTVEHGKHIF